MMCVICGVRPMSEENIICQICEDKLSRLGAVKTVSKLRNMKMVLDSLPYDDYVQSSDVASRVGIAQNTALIYLRELASLGLAEYKYGLFKGKWMYVWKRK